MSWVSDLLEKQKKRQTLLEQYQEKRAERLAPARRVSFNPFRLPGVEPPPPEPPPPDGNGNEAIDFFKRTAPALMRQPRPLSLAELLGQGRGGTTALATRPAPVLYDMPETPSLAELLGQRRGISPVSARVKAPFRMPEPPPPETDVLGGLKVLGEGLVTQFPVQVLSKLKQLTQKGSQGASVRNKDENDYFITYANERAKQFVKEKTAQYGEKRLAPGIKITDVAQLPQNLAYSAVSGGIGTAAGAPFLLIPVAGGWVFAGVTGGVSGKIAMDLTSYEIMQQYLEMKDAESMATKGRGITLAEENKLKAGFQSEAAKYGLWEAIPEGVSNLVGAKLVLSPLMKMFKGGLVKSLIPKLFGAAGGEFLTETITQKGQAGVEFRAGMRAGVPSWFEAFKEIAPQTALLLATTGGAGATAVGSVQAVTALQNEIGAGHPQFSKISAAIKAGLAEERGGIGRLTPESVALKIAQGKVLSKAEEQLRVKNPQAVSTALNQLKATATSISPPILPEIEREAPTGRYAVTLRNIGDIISLEENFTEAGNLKPQARTQLIKDVVGAIDNKTLSIEEAGLILNEYINHPLLNKGDYEGFISYWRGRPTVEMPAKSSEPMTEQALAEFIGVPKAEAVTSVSPKTTLGELVSDEQYIKSVVRRLEGASSDEIASFYAIQIMEGNVKLEQIIGKYNLARFKDTRLIHKEFVRMAREGLPAIPTAEPGQPEAELQPSILPGEVAETNPLAMTSTEFNARYPRLRDLPVVQQQGLLDMLNETNLEETGVDEPLGLADFIKDMGDMRFDLETGGAFTEEHQQIIEAAAKRGDEIAPKVRMEYQDIIGKIEQKKATARVLAEKKRQARAKPQAGKVPPAKRPTARKRVAGESETQRVKAIQEQGKSDPGSVAPQDAKEAHIEMAAPDGPRSPIPPKGTPPSQKDPDHILREIVDKATPGERPDQTLLRLHEAAIGSEQRRINIIVREGNKKLKELGIGVQRRGALIPRTEDIAKLDELYIALHNPSKIVSGEVSIPEGFEAIYKELRDLTDWESAARLDFDPDMATIDDYFYRGWKPPEGAYADVQQGRPLVKTPAFKKPRVNATYQEMRDASFEPLFWNPYQQWGLSRLQGTKYREQMELVSHLKGMGEELIRVDAGGSAPQGWRVPGVGPAFEGKPFATTTPDGEPTVMFTRRWIVPDKVANTLENIYGKKPNFGKFIVAGKTIDPLAIIDWITFLPKRAKLFGSFFQQIDFLTRSGAGSWTRLVDAIAEGKPVKGLTALAKYPQSVGTILRANFSPTYRQKLAQQLDSTVPLVKDRPGINLKGISEAGLSTRDVTIFPADMDKLVRQVVTESGLLAKSKRWVGALGDLESAMRRGLFDGVYTAAITTDIKNNIAPMIARQFSQLNDSQINGMIARVANIKYSTIPASQSVIQNRALRESLRRLFFSTGEAEGLLRQAAGAFHGPYAGFWRKHWLGVYLFLIAVANVIHYASTQEPLPPERYVPIAKNEWGPLPFGYNTQFAAPTLPIKGTGGEEITLDIVGQMDTAFRVLDPGFFIQARQSVPVRATINQVSGTDFYGERIDDVGPGGVVSRTAQLISDLFSPIGLGGLTTELARRNIPMGEEIVPRGERRIGFPGLGIQATGFNVRAITWRTKWADDFKVYDAIPTDPDEAKAQKKPTRTQYRKAYPVVEAKLFITGQVDTISSDMAIEAVIKLVRENKIDPSSISGVTANNEKRVKRRELGLPAKTTMTLTDKLVSRLNQLGKTPAPTTPATPRKVKFNPFLTEE